MAGVELRNPGALAGIKLAHLILLAGVELAETLVLRLHALGVATVLVELLLAGGIDALGKLRVLHHPGALGLIGAEDFGADASIAAAHAAVAVRGARGLLRIHRLALGEAAAGGQEGAGLVLELALEAGHLAEIARGVHLQRTAQGAALSPGKAGIGGAGLAGGELRVGGLRAGVGSGIGLHAGETLGAGELRRVRLHAGDCLAVEPVAVGGELGVGGVLLRVGLIVGGAQIGPEAAGVVLVERGIARGEAGIGGGKV